MRDSQLVDSLGQLRDLLRDGDELLVLMPLVLDQLPLGVREDHTLLVCPVLAISTRVDRKMASSDTIMVRRPNGNFSKRSVVQRTNRMICRCTMGHGPRE